MWCNRRGVAFPDFEQVGVHLHPEKRQAGHFSDFVFQRLGAHSRQWRSLFLCIYFRFFARVKVWEERFYLVPQEGDVALLMCLPRDNPMVDFAVFVAFRVKESAGLHALNCDAFQLD